MVKKLLVLLFPLLALAVIISSANAQSPTTGSAQESDPASKLKEQIILLQQQRKESITEEKNALKVDIQAKRNEFKTKLQAIKDQMKKNVMEQIDAKIVKINTNHTSRYLTVLNRLQEFLDKIKTSSADAKFLADASLAQTAIDDAKSAVDTQINKAYIMEITDETTLKLSARITIGRLRHDLTAVYRLTLDAKKAVRKLYTDREAVEKQATVSANL